jgi:hypothetical protein
MILRYFLVLLIPSRHAGTYADGPRPLPSTSFPIHQSSYFKTLYGPDVGRAIKSPGATEWAILGTVNEV